MMSDLRLGFCSTFAESRQAALLAGYSLPVSRCLTLELVTSTATSGSERETSLASRLWQSIRRALAGRPITDTNWSMMPQGMPAWLCSAAWQARAFSLSLPAVQSVSCSRKLYVATCRDRVQIKGINQFSAKGLERIKWPPGKQSLRRLRPEERCPGWPPRSQAERRPRGSGAPHPSHSWPRRALRAAGCPGWTLPPPAPQQCWPPCSPCPPPSCPPPRWPGAGPSAARSPRCSQCALLSGWPGQEPLPQLQDLHWNVA